MTTTDPTNQNEPIVHEDCPFDSFLPRIPYLVVPKMALQAMPVEWRRQMVALLEQADDAGLSTPDYLVYRAESEYTFVEREDPDDEDSPVVEITPLSADPWSNYRHARLRDVQALSPNFVPTQSPAE